MGGEERRRLSLRARAREPPGAGVARVATQAAGSREPAGYLGISLNSALCLLLSPLVHICTTQDSRTALGWDKSSLSPGPGNQKCAGPGEAPERELLDVPPRGGSAAEGGRGAAHPMRAALVAGDQRATSNIRC